MSATTAAASGQKLSRDDWRKKKELEEARKAGTAPAEVDESGR
jgi:pre-mRNA-processing factor SLU7